VQHLGGLVEGQLLERRQPPEKTLDELIQESLTEQAEQQQAVTEAGGLSGNPGLFYSGAPNCRIGRRSHNTHRGQDFGTMRGSKIDESGAVARDTYLLLTLLVSYDEAIF
jgi:hypothetical protein